MSPRYDFHGQIALVTGASSGMGLAAALAFAQAGASVVLADVNEQPLRAAVDDLTGAGHQAMGVICDVSDEDQVAGMVERAIAQFGRLDMAFNNAGIMVPPTSAAEEPAEQFDRVTAVNLRGVWACMKYELRQMRTQGSGTIETPMVAAMIAGGELDMDEAIANQPIARLGTADEMAAAVLWLCSSGASFVLGVALPVDGGYTAR